MKVTRLFALLKGALDTQVKKAKERKILLELQTKMAIEEEKIATAESAKLAIDFEGDHNESLNKLSKAFSDEKEAKERLQYLKEIEAYIKEEIETEE